MVPSPSAGPFPPSPALASCLVAPRRGVLSGLVHDRLVSSPALNPNVHGLPTSPAAAVLAIPGGDGPRPDGGPTRPPSSPRRTTHRHPCPCQPGGRPRPLFLRHPSRATLQFLEPRPCLVEPPSLASMTGKQRHLSSSRPPSLRSASLSTLGTMEHSPRPSANRRPTRALSSAVARLVGAVHEAALDRIRIRRSNGRLALRHPYPQVVS